MMGLFDMYRYLGNQTALEVVKGCAAWFYDFALGLPHGLIVKMMDLEETGGLLEFWADLYGLTRDPKHLELLVHYERSNLYEALLAGKDVLTNMHANATIPEIQGVARAYEVTGRRRYRRIVERYWNLAVEKRGFYATGGQTCGEVWTPMHTQTARLSSHTQEHCVVYNMMRLAMYLFRWTGEAKYADYWERGLYNGIFAQGYWEEQTYHTHNQDTPPKTGHVAYYLPLKAGSRKRWGSETDHFWCCHCTLVQANADFYEHIYFKKDDALYVAQYIPSKATLDWDGAAVTVTQEENPLSGTILALVGAAANAETLSRPDVTALTFKVDGQSKTFTIKFRKPWWLAGPPSLLVNGHPAEYTEAQGFLCLTRQWGADDQVDLSLPKKLTAHPLEGTEDMAAFLYGPVTLAGLTPEDRTLYGDLTQPETFLTADMERHWETWLPYFRTKGQPVNFPFVPLYEIGDEVYTTYFTVKPARAAAE
jgi:DUF1680 family protein